MNLYWILALCLISQINAESIESSEDVDDIFEDVLDLEFYGINYPQHVDTTLESLEKQIGLIENLFEVESESEEDSLEVDVEYEYSPDEDSEEDTAYYDESEESEIEQESEESESELDQKQRFRKEQGKFGKKRRFQKPWGKFGKHNFKGSRFTNENTESAGSVSEYTEESEDSEGDHEGSDSNELETGYGKPCRKPWCKHRKGIKKYSKLVSGYDKSTEDSEGYGELASDSEESEEQRGKGNWWRKHKKYHKKHGRRFNKKQDSSEESEDSSSDSEDIESNGLHAEYKRKGRKTHWKREQTNKEYHKKHGKGRRYRRRRGVLGDEECKGRVCKMVEKMMKKYGKMSESLMAKTESVTHLCSLASKKFPMRRRTLLKLGSKHTQWLQDWKTWKTNITSCCDMEDVDEIADCVQTVGSMSVPLEISEYEGYKGKNVTIDEQMTKVCRRISKKDWKNLPSHKVRRLSKFQEVGPEDEEAMEESWQARGQAMMDCCELSDDTDRHSCVDDLREQKIDDMCDGTEPIPVHPKKQAAFDECCQDEDEERYDCFGSQRRRKSHGHHGHKDKKGHGHNKHHKKAKDPKFSALRHECCHKGREDGTEVHRRRWAACQKDAFKFLHDKKHLSGAEAKMCRKVLRKCCVRQSHRTIVQEPSTTTANPSVPT